MFGVLKSASLLLGFICLITLVCGKEEQFKCGQKLLKMHVLRKRSITEASNWPWHAAIFKMNNYRCGGSILDANTILTAAYCVSDNYGKLLKKELSVHVGKDHLFGKAGKYIQKHDVKSIIVHSGFNATSANHDIALLKLNTNITMSKYLQPVCLWTMDNEQEMIMGKNGAVIRFELLEENVTPNQLKLGLVKVIDPITCVSKDRDLFGTYLTEDMFCGLEQDGVSLCYGDAGNGMFFKVRGKWFVRGLVSYTARGKNNRCDPLMPTVFTDVAKYLDWIKPRVDQRVLSYENVFDIEILSPPDKRNSNDFL